MHLAINVIFMSSIVLMGQSAIPPRVRAELTMINDPLVDKAIDANRVKECAKLLINGINPVSGGKYLVLDDKHKKYVARIRILRLITGKDMRLDARSGTSRYRDSFPDDQVSSFCLWMSRDIYYFPNRHDQALLFEKWKRELSKMSNSQVDWGKDMNEWWF